MRAALTDDFSMRIVAADRAFPTVMLSPFRNTSCPLWQTGAPGQPGLEAETLAVRGARFAAVAVHFDYGNGMLGGAIQVLALMPP